MLDQPFLVQAGLLANDQVCKLASFIIFFGSNKYHFAALAIITISISFLTFLINRLLIISHVLTIPSAINGIMLFILFYCYEYQNDINSLFILLSKEYLWIIIFPLFIFIIMNIVFIKYKFKYTKFVKLSILSCSILYAASWSVIFDTSPYAGG